MKKPIIAAAVAALSVLSPWAGEKVQIKGSTSIELPKPRHSLEEIKRLQASENLSGRSEVENGAGTPMPVNRNAGPMDKRLKEMIDKKKNWIFVNPYKMQFDSKTERFLEAEKGTGLYDHRLMKDEEKTVLEKFIEEKNPKKESDPQEHTDSTERSPERLAQQAELLGLEKKESQVQESRFFQENGVGGRKFESQPLVGERSLFQQKLERATVAESRFNPGGSALSEQSDFRKEREQRNLELNQLFQARPAVTGPGFQPLNGALDGNRGEFSPIGRRSEPFLGGAGREIGGAVPARNSPIFSGGPSALGGGADTTSLPGRSPVADFGVRPAQPSAFTPAANSPATALPSPTANPAPFVLPLPQRKF